MNGSPDEGALVGTVRPQAATARAGPCSSTAGAVTAVSSSPGCRRTATHPTANPVARTAAGRRRRDPGPVTREPGGRAARHRVGAGGGRGSAPAAAHGAARARRRSVRCDLRTGYTALLDRPVDELLVVHGDGRTADDPADDSGGVRLVPAAVAALASVDAATTDGADRPVPDAVVVDVGHSGTEIARVSGGRVVAACRVPVGARSSTTSRRSCSVYGAEPGRPGCRTGPRSGPPASVVASAGGRGWACRPSTWMPMHFADALTPHLAAVVDGVRAVRDGAGPGRSPPVLLVGGIARTPLLAELLDAAGVPDVRVAVAAGQHGGRGCAATVTGLARPAPAPHPWGRPGVRGGPVPGGVRLRRPTLQRRAPVSASAGGAPAALWLPPVAPPRHRPLRGRWRSRPRRRSPVPACTWREPRCPRRPVPPRAGDLVQYGYAVRLPAGWAHTGGLPERRRSLLTPVGAPDGSDLISVERTPLGYDADAEPQRARAELRAEFDPGGVGRCAAVRVRRRRPLRRAVPVVGYREPVRGGTDGTGPSADAAEVDWYVRARRRGAAQRGLPAHHRRCVGGRGGLRDGGRIAAPHDVSRRGPTRVHSCTRFPRTPTRTPARAATVHRTAADSSTAAEGTTWRRHGGRTGQAATGAGAGGFGTTVEEMARAGQAGARRRRRGTGRPGGSARAAGPAAGRVGGRGGDLLHRV